MYADGQTDVVISILQTKCLAIVSDETGSIETFVLRFEDRSYCVQFIGGQAASS